VTIFQILVLAVIQGITEFLPISSSGHLLLVPLLTDWPDQGLAVDIAAHVGTLFAVMLYFRQDILQMIRAVIGMSSGEDRVLGRKLAAHVVIGTIPAVAAGALIVFVSEFDFRSILMIAVTTLVFGAVLGLADRFAKGTRTLRSMNSWDALFIGIFQIFALLPGTSRSGVTMAAALLRGIDRTDSARFSMLLSIPVIIGAGTIAGIRIAGDPDAVLGMDALIAAVASFVVAYLVIHLLMRWIARIGYMPFVWYRMVLGVFLLVIYLMQ
jgi:undecaprenyl-diphosphatase